MEYDDWKKIQVPLGLLVSLLVVVAGAYGWARSELVWAADFSATIQSIQQGMQDREARGLEREAKKTEIEIIKLKTKQQVAPHKFDAIDKATLDANKQDLIELKAQITEVKSRSMPAK